MSLNYDELQGLVIMNNSRLMHAGFSGDDSPRAVFPTVTGFIKYKAATLGAGQKTFYLEQNSVLTVISEGKETGTVVSMGHDYSSVTAVYERSTLSTVEMSDVSGSMLSHYFNDSIKKKTEKYSLNELIKSKNEINKSLNRVEHLMKELKTKNAKSKKNIIFKSFNSTKRIFQETKMKIREADVTEVFINESKFDDLKLDFKQIGSRLDKIEESLKVYDNENQLKDDEFHPEGESLDQSLSFMPSRDQYALSSEDSSYLDTQSKIQHEKMEQMEILEEEMRGLHSANVDIHQLLTEQGESLIGSSDQLESATKYVDYGVTEINATSKLDTSTKCKIILIVIILCLIVIGLGISILLFALPKIK
eukprot:gene6495-10503_t